MSSFAYRPKFVDVRIRPPGDRARRAETGERLCDRPDCDRPGTCRAPKSRAAKPDYWMFCPDHAADYNRAWNFFADMSDEEIRSYQESEFFGHRPMWSFRDGRMSDAASATASARAQRRARPMRDTYSLFSFAEEAERRAKVSPLIERCYEELDLEPGAKPEIVRARYADYVKRFHPDANDGDRSMEQKLHRVIRAYQTLKAGGRG